MKLLIVDDEKHVITTLRCLIPAKQLGITEILSAQTCAEAKMILEKERPEIAIVDIILQNQTGMSLLAFIINRHLPTQIIAISGHSDYEYVRAMLLNGAVDYLLKPVEVKALTASLQKALSRVHPQSQETPAVETAMNMSLSIQYIRTQLRKMLLSANAAHAYEELAGLDPQFATAHTCTLMYYDLHCLPSTSTAFRYHLSQFEEKVKNYLALHKSGYLLDKFTSQHEQLLMLTNDDGTNLRQIEAMAMEAFASTPFAFHMGCAQNVPFPEGFVAGEAQAKACFFADSCFLTPELLQKRLPTGGKAENPSAIAPAGLERSLLSWVVVQDIPKAQAEAETWLNGILTAGFVSLGHVQAVIDFYNAMTVRWLHTLRDHFEAFAHERVSERLHYADFLDEYFAFSPQMMVAGVQRHLRLFGDQADRVFVNVDVFDRIAFYMELNYDQPFKQNDYARMFHLNRDYLSRKFKQIYGDGMISHLNHLRILQAERLMRDPKLKIRSIAFMTGFSDEKYFSRQFKEYFHVTPSEYRAMMRVEEDDPAD